MMLFVYPLTGDFKPSDKVIDTTAEYNGWSDTKGTVLEVDGSHVKIKYESGAERWKKHINLRHQE